MIVISKTKASKYFLFAKLFVRKEIREKHHYVILKEFVEFYQDVFSVSFTILKSE